MKNFTRCAAGFAALLAAGCSTTVVRENVLASVNTTIGTTVMENDETQLYEARMGFIRHQFYSVPTGKVVEGTNQVNCPQAVPQLVSGLRAQSGVRQLWLGSDTSENFAVGVLGVTSPAAVAMFVSDGENAAYVSNALRGVSVTVGSFKKDPAIFCLTDYWRPGKQINIDHQEKLQVWIDAKLGHDVEIPDFLTFGQYVVQRRLAMKALGIDCANTINNQTQENLCQPAK